MIYDGRPNNGCDGQWHCPFSPKWVERMRRAAKHCKPLSAEYIARCINNEKYIYQVPPGDFLSKPQNARGMPIGYGGRGGVHVTCDIYDYDTIPDVVVTNGREDWPLCLKGSMLMA